MKILDIDEKSIYELHLHEVMWIDRYALKIMRVPTGFIYTSLADKGKTISQVCVPYLEGQ